MKLSLPQSRKSTCPIIKVLSRKGAATFSSWKCCKILFTDNPNLCSYLSFFSLCIFICIVEVYNYKHCTNPNFKFNSCYLFSVSFFHTGAIFAFQPSKCQKQMDINNKLYLFPTKNLFRVTNSKTFSSNFFCFKIEPTPNLFLCQNEGKATTVTPRFKELSVHSCISAFLLNELVLLIYYLFSFTFWFN